MEFSVHTPDETEWAFHGKSTYDVGESNGVLTVNDEDSKAKITFGPSGWLRVDEPEEVLTW
jgi:hypothetical protein